ncbi:MAG: nitrate reductase associated protein [Cyanobacteria bacterium]|nr:nitrate reductase associated protein [Cyanobacteriota bacterium]MDA0865316.1 nitrate reductase associated protein [Cyanobacteriota bacterium]
MDEPQFFQFETDFVAELRCIPMQVRFKLDTCGVKLKLSHWNHFSQPERQALVCLPCDTAPAIEAYRSHVQAQVSHHTGQPAALLPIDPEPPWHSTHLPAQVQTQAQTLQIALDDQQWQQLSPLQRFALLKLSQKGHENHNFLPALQEFALVASP